mgnify:CR=1 FL=1
MNSTSGANSGESGDSRLGQAALCIGIVVSIMFIGAALAWYFRWESWPFNIAIVNVGSVTGLALAITGLIRLSSSSRYFRQTVAGVVVNAILIIVSVLPWFLHR